MKAAFSLATIVAAAGLACSAMGQDSVSKNGSGLPGDALNPWTTGVHQVANYGVDLVPIFTSCGDRFGIAPIAKASKAASGFFSSLWSAQGISQTILRDLAATARPSYDEWLFFPGAGVHPSENFAGTSTSPISWTPYGFNQFGAAFAEFATDDGGKNVNNIISAVVNYAPERPGRLWVSRVVSAVNETASGVGDDAQFGFGAIDAAGHTYLRADNFGVTGPNPIGGNNYYRVDALARSSALVNSIKLPAVGDAAATDKLLNGSATTHNTPSCVPSELSGLVDGRLLGSNFNTLYVYENPANTLASTAAHRAGTVDHRGAVTFSQVQLVGGIGTAAIIGKSTAANGDPSDRVCFWGVNINGGVGSQYTLNVPFVVSDSCYASPSLWDGLTHHSSQTFSRGSNGQIAVGKDQAGRGLLAGVLTSNRTSTVNPFNAIAVCRFDTGNPVGTAVWNLAAWTDTPATDGKDILGDFGADGAPFTGDVGEFDGVCDALDAPIGRMASFSELGIAGLIGPSVSAPAFDSVGNIWFLSSVALNKFDSQNQVYFTDYDTALLRATYDPDNYCYDLELVLELGDTFDGMNSGVTWQVQFLDLVDSNSVSSGTIFSQNSMQAAWNNIDPTSFVDENFNFTTRDTRALGGLVLCADIVYDVDFDQDFDDPTSAGGDPNSIDESYSVLLFIGNTSKGCPSDWNGDGFVTGDDFDQYVAAFIAGDMASDYNGDGFPNGDDFDAFVIDFEAGC